VSDSVFYDAKAIAKAMRRESVFGLDRPDFDVMPTDQPAPTPVRIPDTSAVRDTNRSPTP
jgi:hypothetical protein